MVRLTNIPAGKKVSFSTAFPPDMPDLTADPVHVANVLSNLIENAIKYSGEEVDIDIVVLWNQQRVELTVSDNASVSLRMSGERCSINFTVRLICRISKFRVLGWD